MLKVIKEIETVSKTKFDDVTGEPKKYSYLVVVDTANNKLVRNSKGGLESPVAYCFIKGGFVGQQFEGTLVEGQTEEGKSIWEVQLAGEEVVAE